MKGQMDIMAWLLVATSLIGSYLITKRRVEGFYFWSVSNIGWVAVDLRAGVPAQAALFVMYLGMSIYGAWEWKRKQTLN